MTSMDTTPDITDPLTRVAALLEALTTADPAESIEPMAEIAELLEQELDHGDDT